MPRLDAPFVPPKNTTTEVSDGARAAFQNEEAEQLFTGLGLNDGGFQANADRVFMLDDTGSLVPAPPYDSEKDKNMTAAAQNGRLYIMDKDRRLRQVRLEGNENDGFAFAVTSSLSRQQQPRRSFAYRIRYMQSVLRDISKAWQRLTGTEADRARLDASWKEVKEAWKDVWKTFKQDMAKFRDDMKADWADLKSGKFSFTKSWNRTKKSLEDAYGRRNRKAEPEKVKVENEPLIPEEEPVQTKQTVNTPKEEQIQQPTQSELTTEQLLATKPTKLTNDQFLTYLDALDNRGKGTQISDVMKNKKATAENYYEALAQGMEGQVARQIKAQADGQTDPEVKEQFLKEQKPIMASISLGLREYVKENSNQAVVNEYFDARAKGTSTDAMETNVLQDSKNVQEKGVNGYLETVNNSNAAMRQNQSQLSRPQPQPNQVQQQMQAKQMQGMGGRG